MKLVNPFVKYSLKAWTIGYAKAVAVLIVVLLGAGVLGYGVCEEPLRFSSLCDAPWLQSLIQWVSRAIGEVLPYIVKVFFVAYVIKALVSVWTLVRGGKKTSSAAPRRQPGHPARRR
jgi:hypothetical protein